MSYRRTRSQKDRIQARRESSLSYSWKPEDHRLQDVVQKTVAAPAPIKKSEPSSVAELAVRYFGLDLMHTLLGVVLTLGLLALFWWNLQ